MNENTRLPAILGLIAFAVLARGQETYLKRVPVGAARVQPRG